MGGSWENTTHVEISWPHNNYAALKYANRKMRFGSQLLYQYYCVPEEIYT